ncbi:hypothetical protein ABBQ32_012200 [Trebouxia sp. C0010 RCD-2024]
MAGTKTAPHATWADAKNFAIAIGRKVKQGTALARWVFVHPCSIIRANEYVRREVKQCPEGFDKCTKEGRDTFDTFPSQADVAKLSKFLGKDLETGCAYVRTVYQHHGQVVHVPAGWLHQVENLQDCVKIAWDRMVPERMAAYMATWQLVLASVIKSNAPDYMAATGVLWVAVQKL